MKNALHIHTKSLVLPLLGLVLVTGSGCASSQNGAPEASRMTGSIDRPAQRRAEDDEEPTRPVPADPYKNARYKGGRDPVSGIAPNLDGSLPEPLQPARKAATTGGGRTAAATARPQTAAVAPVRASAAVVSGGSTIQVQPGDTLGKIARTNGVTVAALMQANGLSSPAIMVGQTLVLPAK